MVRYAPSLMCANYLHLEKDIKDMDRAQVDFYHIDIMDGHFVPNLSLNFDIIRYAKKATETPMDVHLMVDNLEAYLPMIDKIKPEYVSFHIETIHHPIRLIKQLKDRNIKVGIAISPATPLDSLEYIIKDLDYVLVMTVEPGYAGQRFIPAMLDKISRLSQMRSRFNKELLIEVDGNISLERGTQCIEAGADILVLGTASIFKEGKDLYTSVIEFKNSVDDSTAKLAN
jgi:ribulose-phosphate 3-epimerase